MDKHQCVPSAKPAKSALGSSGTGITGDWHAMLLLENPKCWSVLEQVLLNSLVASSSPLFKFYYVALVVPETHLDQDSLKLISPPLLPEFCN